MFKLIDVDRHINEPRDLWAEYVDAEIYRKAPVGMDERTVEIDGAPVTLYRPTVAGLSIVQNWPDEVAALASHGQRKGRKERYDAMHPISQLRAMDESGIHIGYLMPNFASNIVNHGGLSAEVSIAYADGYNRWLKDYVKVQPERLKAVGMISRHDPATMLAQLDKIIEYGWRAVVLRPEAINGVVVGDEVCQPFFAACAANNIAVLFHGGTHLVGETLGSNRFKSRFALQACAHPMELQMAFLSLLESGTLHRNPTLKVGLLEGGVSWVPHWLWRLDNICYPEFPELLKGKVEKPPSQYFKQHCWVAVEPGEPCLGEFISVVGHDKILFGSDYPHIDHLHLDPYELFDPSLDLSEAQLKDIFENNPLALFEGGPVSV